jgi:tetratricopeptide (TPR) repeat protein
MGLIDWLFSSFDDPETAEEGSEWIELPTGDGETSRISRERYGDEILPDQIEEAGDDPEQLFQTLRLAVDKDVLEPCLEAARRLRELDPDRERSATLLGLIHWKMDRLDRAEEVYASYLDEHGESGVVLMNLARVHDNRGDRERTKETLWRAIEVRPNLENAVDWWASLHADEVDDDQAHEAYRRALREVADLSDAWYARARLAHFHLEQGDKEEGLAVARKVAAEAGGEPRVMMLLTGPLGEHGHLDEMIELFGEQYDPSRHSPFAGLNLVHACIETEREELGRELLEALEDEDDPEIRESLEQAREALEK